MSKLISIHQPETFPWCGFFYKMMKSDEFIVLDNVQFKKNNFQNRNRILHNGIPKWLTFPVVMQGHLSSTIADIKLADTVDWRERNVKVLKYAYNLAPYFDIHMNKLEEIINNSSDSLLRLNMSIIEYIKDYLGITTQIIYSSQLGVTSKKSDLVLDICKERKASEYISGSGGRDYLNLGDFEKENIKVSYLEFDEEEVYFQPSSLSFNPYLSIIDLIMNNDKEASLYYLNEAFSIVNE